MKYTEIFYLLSYYDYDGEFYRMNYSDRIITVDLRKEFLQLRVDHSRGAYCSTHKYDNDACLNLISHIVARGIYE